MTKPRILFVVPSLARAGAEKQAVDLANGLAAKGFECHLTSFDPNRDQLDRLDLKRVRYHELTRRRKFDFAIIGSIANIVDTHQIDIVHCTLNMALLFGNLARKKSTRQPAVIAGVHTTLNPTKKEDILGRFVYRWHFRSANRVVFVCHRQMEYWVTRDPKLAGHGLVIYNGVDNGFFDRKLLGKSDSELKRDLGIPESDPAICCIAAFRPEKAQGFIVQAVANLAGSHPKVQLLLAGQGPGQPAVKRAAAELGISERVHFLGNLADVRPVLGASEFSIISSVAVETFSFAMLESMSMGTAVLSSRIGGADEAVVPGSTGMLVTPGSVGELTLAMKELLDDPVRTREFGKQARKMVEEKFNYNMMVDETSTLMSQVYDEYYS